MQVIVNSLLTQYARLGKGKSIIIIPGWANDSKSWQIFQKRLSESYDVIVLDLPGFGGSQRPATNWGLSEYSTFVGAFLEKLNTKPYAIIGHSNGGAIAVRGLALKHFSTQRLVLLACAGIRSSYKSRKKILRLITKTGKILSTPLPHNTKNQLRQKVYKKVGSDMLVAEHMQGTFKKIVEDDIQADAPKIDSPTLLIYGEDDQQTPLWYGQQFHELINGSSLEILPGVGHFIQLERPYRVIKTIREFLQ
ncbi:MAG: alpha/beta fold hydrolase [Candidatus Saccharimonadales bacterium]